MYIYSKGLIEQLLTTNLPLDDFLEYSSTPPWNQGKVVRNIFDYNKATYMETLDPDHHFKFGFKNLSVTLVGYKITSAPTGGSHLNSWHLYGSNDQINWTLLDYVPNDSKLRGISLSAVYRIPEPKGPFKYYLFKNVTTFYIQEKILIADFDVYDTIFSKVFVVANVTCRKSLRISLQHYHIFVLIALE